MDGYIAHQNNISEPQVINELQALAIEWQIFFIFLYTLTSILSLSENLIVISVQMFGKNFEPVLRKCLINLAIADICVGVLSVPFTYTDFMLGHWIFPHFMCPLSQFAVLLSVFVTCYTLTLISLERYILIVHPIYHSSNFKAIESYTTKLLLIGWGTGALLSGISLIFCEIKSFKWQNNVYYDCRLMFNNESTEKSYVLLLFIFTFLLPLVLQTTFYTLVSMKLKRLKSSVSVDRIKVIKMLALLVIMFAICWLPIRLFFLIVIFNKHIIDFKTTTQYHIYVFTYFAVHFLSMFNSCINPIVYCFKSQSFRDDFWHLMGRTTRFRQNNGIEMRKLINRTVITIHDQGNGTHT